MLKDLISLGVCLLLSGALHAQITRPAEDSTQTTVEEIVVTAQKRAESIQTVPIAITAVSGDTLQRAGITDIGGVQMLTPGMAVSNIGAGYVSYTYIRGGGSNQVDLGSDPSVAYFIDEVYIGGTAGLEFDLFDIDHIEVLKGPQGTLFGRNAASGAVSIVTKRPSDTFEGYADFEAGNYGGVIARAGVTGPINGTDLLYRASIGYKRHDGFTDNLTGGEDPGAISSVSGRGQLEWKTDTTMFLLTADALRSQNGQTNQFFSTTNTTALVALPAAATFPLPGESFYKHYYHHDGFADQNLYDLTGRFEWNTPLGQLTSITAYRDNQFTLSQDYSPGTDSIILDTNEHDRTYSQELRLASATDQRLRWLGGLYYYRGNQSLIYSFISGPNFVAPILQNVTRTENTHLTTNSYAAFGQGSFDIVDKLTLIVGLRYTIDEKEDNRVDVSTEAFLPWNYTVNPSDRWHALTPAVTLQYAFTTDAMAYASYREGFKSGGFQPALPVSPALASTPFQPEHVKSYELGYKSAWLDRKITFDADLFLSKISDQQIQEILPGAVDIVNNAGATTAKGVDLALKLRPTSALRLSADVTYQRARFDRYETLVGPLLANYAGKTQLRSPDFSSAFTGDYDFNLNGWGLLTLSGQYSYRTKTFFDSANTESPGLYQPAYGLLDSRLIFSPPNARWQAGLWVKNLTNVDYYRNVIDVNPTGLAQPGDPRTFGGSFNVKFN